MDFGQSFKMAFKQLTANKMRSALTMLGIIIGVVAVVLLVSIGNSMTAKINQQMGDLGSNIIMASINSKNPDKNVSYNQVQKFKEINGIKNISPVTSGKISIRKDKIEKKYNVIGTNSEYGDIQNVKVAKGRFLLPVDIDYNNKVAVIGPEVATKMFGNQNPIGQTINIGGLPHIVIGVLEDKSGGISGSTNDALFVPLKTAQTVLKNGKISMVYVAMKSSDVAQRVMNSLETKLYDILKDEDSYNVMNQQEIIDMMDKMNTTLSIALGGISGISLVVAGIGIMNIMLVAVTERTKEIGIRKALGARRKTILGQFLIESMVMSLTGGVIGSLIGGTGALIINLLLGLGVIIPWGTILFALIFSMAAGIFFGIMPANKAAKLQPIDALRAN
jgi:putative ABC transport system permease protein